MSKHTYGDFTIDTAELPAKSLEALINRGITHFLGNEQASKVSAWVKGLEEAEGAPKVADDEKAAKKAELVKAAYQALVDGTIGSGHGGGPKLDPLQRAIRDIAEEEVSSMLKGAGQKVPKGKETISVKGQDLTLADLVKRRVENAQHADRILKAAKARVASAAKASEGASLDDL